MFITKIIYIFEVLQRSNQTKQSIMKVSKIQIGIYKVVDAQGTWIARFSGTCWAAYDCDNDDDTHNDNNWGVSFKTFKELKAYSQSFLNN